MYVSKSEMVNPLQDKVSDFEEGIQSKRWTYDEKTNLYYTPENEEPSRFQK